MFRGVLRATFVKAFEFARYCNRMERDEEGEDAFFLASSLRAHGGRTHPKDAPGPTNAPKARSSTGQGEIAACRRPRERRPTAPTAAPEPPPAAQEAGGLPPAPPRAGKAPGEPTARAAGRAAQLTGRARAGLLGETVRTVGACGRSSLAREGAPLPARAGRRALGPWPHGIEGVTIRSALSASSVPLPLTPPETKAMP